MLREASPDGQYELLLGIVPVFMHQLIGVQTPPDFTLYAKYVLAGAEADAT